MPTALALSDIVWGRIEHAHLSVTVYDAKVTGTPDTEQWAVYYPDAGTPYSDRAGGGFQELRWGFYLVCCGYTRQQVLNTVAKMRDVLLGWAPTAAALLDEQDIAAPLIRDDALDPARLSITLRFTLQTTRS